MGRGAAIMFRKDGGGAAPQRERSIVHMEGVLPMAWFASMPPLEMAGGTGSASMEGHLAQSRAASAGGLQKTLSLEWGRGRALT